MTNQLSGGELGWLWEFRIESVEIVELRVSPCDKGSCGRVAYVSVGLRLGSPDIGSHKNLVVGPGARPEVSGNRLRVFTNRSS